MAREFRAEKVESYKMEYADPHRQLEPAAQEEAVIGSALASLVEAGVLPHHTYDQQRFLAHRQAVRELFEIPWTGITPRMQRLLYAINAITRPGTMLAAGVFCGNTFISNAGAAVGPGAVYQAECLLGVEINPEEAARGERNVRRIDPTRLARIVAADAIDVARDFDGVIDLLYLDATGASGQGKSIYLDILQAARPNLASGALVLAHNSFNSSDLDDYLAFVRNPVNLRESVNVLVDCEGLEVSRNHA